MINSNIVITEHICQRYMERINQNLLSITDYKARLNAAEQAIKSILQDAQYVSDDERGILLRSKTFDCDIIVHKRQLITIYPSRKKSKERNK